MSAVAALSACEATSPLVSTLAPSSSGLGHRPFTAVTGVRVPLGSLLALFRAPRPIDFLAEILPLGFDFLAEFGVDLLQLPALGDRPLRGALRHFRLTAEFFQLP